MKLAGKDLLKGISAFIFDFDLTLFNISDHVDWKGVGKELRAYLKSHSFLIGGGSTLPIPLIRDAPAHFAGDGVELREAWLGAHAILCRYECAAAESASIYPGVRETVEWMRDAGVATAIASSNCETVIHRVLERNSMEGCFDFIAGRESTLWEMKPSPYIVRCCLRELGAEAELTAGIGDSAVDIIAFLSAGVRAIGMKGGMSTGKQLEEAGAAAVLSHISDLLL